MRARKTMQTLLAAHVVRLLLQLPQLPLRRYDFMPACNAARLLIRLLGSALVFSQLSEKPFSFSYSFARIGSLRSL